MRSSQQKLRAVRTRKSLDLGAGRMRLSVFRSSRHIWAQIIDDQKGRTLVAASSKVLGRSANRDVAREVGKRLAVAAKKKKITNVVFDRGPYHYHGQLQALAEGAREGGLVF